MKAFIMACNSACAAAIAASFSSVAAYAAMGQIL